MNNQVEEIKKKLDIVDFVSPYITLKKAGRNFKANCPFHQEKSASLIISPDRQIWHCFGACQTGGDVISFFMKIERITFFEAMQELAKRVGVKLNTNAIDDGAWKKKERLYEINKLVSEYYHYLLMNHAVAKKARTYLEKRKVNKKIWESFQIGYAPDSWDNLTRFLIKKGYSLDELEKAAVSMRNARGGYDRFRHRLMFPLKDHRGNVLGFSGRILDDDNSPQDTKQAKYINSPETEIYHKREMVFGLQLSQNAIKEKETVLIVEGEFDMISLYENGIANVVAVKGSAITREQLILLKRFCHKIIFALDADSSGRETIKRTLPEAEALEFETFVLQYDFAKDPDEAIHKDPIRFKKLVENPISIYDFFIDLAIKNNPRIDDPFTKKKIAQEVIPYFIYIKNPIVKEFYEKKIATLIDSSVESVDSLTEEAIRKTRLTYEVPVDENSKATATSRREHLEKYSLALIFQDKDPLNLFHTMNSLLTFGDYASPGLSELFSCMDSYAGKQAENVPFSFDAFIAHIPSQLIKTFDSLVLYDLQLSSMQYDEKEIKKTWVELKKLSLREQIKSLSKGEERQPEITELTKQLSTLEKNVIIL